MRPLTENEATRQNMCTLLRFWLQNGKIFILRFLLDSPPAGVDE